MNSRKKIICLISGGLGNQLFTYAAAYSLAKSNNAQLIIDKKHGFLFDKKYSRKFLLNKFNITSKVLDLHNYLLYIAILFRKINLFFCTYLNNLYSCSSFKLHFSIIE